MTMHTLCCSCDAHPKIAKISFEVFIRARGYNNCFSVPDRGAGEG